MIATFIIEILLSLFIFGMLTFYFLKRREEERVNGIMLPAFFIGIIHLILAALSFLWLFNFLIYASSDFLSIYSLLILVQGFFIFLIVYNISEKNSRLFPFLFAYIIVFFLILFLDISFMKFFIEAYFLFVLLISLSLLSRKDDYRNIGIFGALYSGISLLLHGLVIAGFANLYTFSIIYGALLIFFLFMLLRYLQDNPLPIQERIVKKKSYSFVFLRNFVFILALINFVFIGTIVIHELGHLFVSYFYNCTSRAIVYSGGIPDTQILCTNLHSELFVALGGILLPILLGTIILFIGGKLLREIGLLMIGFNLIVSSMDFIDIGFSSNIAIFLVLLGIVFTASGIILLAKSRAEDYVFSMESISQKIS